MTRLEYPSDYHPLAPVIRQLRGSLKWLDQSGIPLETLQISSLLQRLEQLPKTRIKDHRTIQLAQYWQQLPYASPDTLDVKHDKQLELSTHNSKTLQNESVNSPKLKAQDGPCQRVFLLLYTNEWSWSQSLLNKPHLKTLRWMVVLS